MPEGELQGSATRSRCRSDPIKFRDRAQNLAAMPKQDAEVLEVLPGQEAGGQAAAQRGASSDLAGPLFRRLSAPAY
jgi:hypothetical protein